jgi:hypothetical protein
MKTIWTLPFISRRFSQIKSLRQTRIFLRPVVGARLLSQAVFAESASSRETSDMAPKFELKTPKGTKDCKSLHDRDLTAYKSLRALRALTKSRN